MHARKLEKLPLLAGAMSTVPLWGQSDPEDMNIVFLASASARPDDHSVDLIRNMRRDMRRILGDAIQRGEGANLDLINSPNALAKRLPSVAGRRRGRQRQMRAVYLEALGAAILPALEGSDIAALEKHGAVVLSNRMIHLELPATKSDGTVAMDFWHHEHVNYAAVRDRKLTGKGVTIGILDTGIDADHPEFSGKAIEYIAFDRNGEPRRNRTPRDFGSHGTHVAGICAGRTVGLAPNASLSVAAVLTEYDAHGRIGGYFAQILRGLDWLSRTNGPDGQGVAVINASLGFPELKERDSLALYSSINRYRTIGGLLVAAVGNDGLNGSGRHSFPAKFDHVIAVGAVNRDNCVAEFSDWGPARNHVGESKDHYKPDLVAPGVGINSSVPGGGYMLMSGTSMATPAVSAAVAMLIEQEPSLRNQPDRLRERLLELTVELDPLAHIDMRQYGKGRLDLALIP